MIGLTLLPEKKNKVLKGKQMALTDFTHPRVNRRKIVDEDSVIASKFQEGDTSTENVIISSEGDSGKGQKVVLGGMNKIHEAHRVGFSIEYTGFPSQGFSEGKLVLFGKSKEDALKSKQWVFSGSGYRLLAYKKRLVCWVFNPQGVLTPEQLSIAGQKAGDIVKSFTEKHNLALIGGFKRIGRSEHVVVSKEINGGLRPVFEHAGAEIDERIGSKLCNYSHGGKIEHTGVDKPYKQVSASDVAINVEWLFMDFPKQFAMSQKGLMDGLGVLSQMLIKQTEVLIEIRDAVKKK